MNEWAARRFWTRTRTLKDGAGHGILLDERRVKTPAGVPLRLPNAPLAQAVAEEWAAQTDVIAPGTMPMTRMANTAIDKVGPGRDALVATLTEYGETDLLCYRADRPAALAARQAEGWDPLLDWAERRFGARLRVTTGVVPVDQPPAAVAALAAPLHAADAFALTALDDLVALSGSLVLGLAVADGRLAPEVAWGLSQIDETWQAEQWGVDPEARAAALNKGAAFSEAAHFLALAKGRDD